MKDPTLIRVAHNFRPRLGRCTIGALAAALCALGVLAAPAPLISDADAATKWKIRGAGWGHGVGMSQYGAYGFARRGTGYRDILAHYYRGTSIGSSGTQRVRVLVKQNQKRVRFTGVTKACGRKMGRRATYYVTRRDALGSRVVLRSRSGRALRTCESPLRATGPGPITIRGVGRYRGSLEVRAALFSGLNAINSVGLESYTKGVVPNESPSGWPIEALKAQAVAARTYAIATRKNGLGFDHYDDVRSQVYRGIESETSSTNRAVRATSRKIVTYDGEPAVTYFFSTSGGRTENVEYAWPGSKPKPWLKSVRDPYDKLSKYHRWGPITLSKKTMERRLKGLVRGSLRDIRVDKRGRSPRIVSARIIGSKGSRRVSGGTLRTKLKLRDTWIYFTKVNSSSSEPTPTTTVDEPDSGGQEGPTDTTG